MNATETPEWIAVDWGTSNLRAYAMQGGTVVARAQSEKGMAALTPEQFEPTLEYLVEFLGTTRRSGSGLWYGRFATRVD